MIIAEHLRDKYHRESPEERWQLEIGEYHSSAVYQCQRKHYYSFTEDYESPGSSSYPYFELGNTLEDFYGEALATKFGYDRVIQDVMIEARFTDEIVLTGESDWCVLREEIDVDRVEEMKYILEDGEVRETITWSDNRKTDVDRAVSADDYENPKPLVAEVFETKTTKNVGWKDSYGFDDGHYYQLSCYMGVIGVPGRIVYIERNDLSERQFEFEPSENTWLDIEFRVMQHHQNLVKDELPPTTPTDGRECKYCEYKSQCKAAGGKIWE